VLILSTASLEKIVRCSALLEKIVGDFYIELSRKVDKAEARARLLYIGYDSYKHYQLLVNYAVDKQLPSIDECRESYGYFIDKLSNLNVLSMLDKISGDELRSWISSIENFENSVGEELFHKMIFTMASKLDFKGKEELILILKLLADDEEKHANLLKEILYA
jgi:rubrerythrin